MTIKYNPENQLVTGYTRFFGVKRECKKQTNSSENIQKIT